MALGRCREQLSAPGRNRRGEERSCGKHALQKRVSLDGPGRAHAYAVSAPALDQRGDTIMLRMTAADGLSETDVHHIGAVLNHSVRRTGAAARPRQSLKKR